MVTQFVWGLIEKHVTPYIKDFNPSRDVSISWYAVRLQMLSREMDLIIFFRLKVCCFFVLSCCLMAGGAAPFTCITLNCKLMVNLLPMRRFETRTTCF